MVRVTDCSGRVTQCRYHPLGWLVAEISADGEETRYRYDAAGRPVQLDRPEGWTESLKWNERGLPVKHAGADGKESEFRYDEAGRLTATRNTQGEEVRRRWDSRGRLIAPKTKTAKRISSAGARTRCCWKRWDSMARPRSIATMPAGVR